MSSQICCHYYTERGGTQIFNVEGLIPDVKRRWHHSSLLLFCWVLFCSCKFAPPFLQCLGVGGVTHPLTEEVEWSLCFKTMVLITPDRAEIWFPQSLLTPYLLPPVMATPGMQQKSTLWFSLYTAEYDNKNQSAFFFLEISFRGSSPFHLLYFGQHSKFSSQG